MATVLAAPELLASPLGATIATVEQTRLGGQEYLLVELLQGDGDQDELLSTWMRLLPRLSATGEGYEYFTSLAALEGPFLRPLEPDFVPFVPLEMAEVRRYKGKTNELFTRVLLNMAIFAGAYAEQFDTRLRVLDPLAGGGTTLFHALAMGYDAFGIEHSRQDVESSEVFVRQYFQGERISYKELNEKGRRAGQRIQFEVGRKGDTRTLVLVHGETAQAVQHLHEVPGGPRVHAIVADLPYGIQHFGEVTELLSEALPVWERLLVRGGTLALAWNATRIERSSLCQLIETRTGLRVRNQPPYTQMEHAVDRVIKKRDIVIAYKASDPVTE